MELAWTCTKCRNSYNELSTCQNDISLNLCVVPPTSHIVTILKNDLVRSCKERDKARYY